VDGAALASLATLGSGALAIGAETDAAGEAVSPRLALPQAGRASAHTVASANVEARPGSIEGPFIRESYRRAARFDEPALRRRCRRDTASSMRWSRVAA
jgi:hypothetical protein